MKPTLILILVSTLIHSESYGKSVPTPTHSEGKYGTHKRNVLDFGQ